MNRILFTLIVMISINGCRMLPKDINQNEYDVNSLRTTDKTYQITEPQIIKVNDDKKIEMLFDSNWFLVHNDWIKTFNKNQDTLLDLLENLDKNNVTAVSNILQSILVERIK